MTISASQIAALPIFAEQTDSSPISQEQCFGPAMGAGRDFDVGLTVSGDYAIIVTIEIDVSTQQSRPFGNATDFNGRGAILATSANIVFTPDSSSAAGITANGAYPSDTGPHEVTFLRQGSTGFIFVDGVQVQTGAVPTGDLNFLRIGRNSTSVSNGTLYEVKLVQEGNTTNYWPLFSKTDGLLNLSDIAGTETLTANGFTAGVSPGNTQKLTYCPR